MKKYKVILYKLSLGDYFPKINTESLFFDKDIYTSYDVILAQTLSNLIPDCDLEVVYDSDVNCETLLEYKINQDDEYGIEKQNFNNTFPLFDFLVIKNQVTNKYLTVDFQDGPRHTLTFAKNKNCVGGYSCMYLDLVRDVEDKNFYLNKIYPFTFFDIYPYLTRQYRKEIQKIRSSTVKIPKLVFYGTIGNVEKDIYFTTNISTGNVEPVREVVRVLKEKYPQYIDVKDREEKLKRQEWWKLAATYTLPITIPGHPWCSREHEFWALGIPTLANTYTCPLMFPLTANKHYIDAGTRGKDFMDREIDQEYAADLLIKKFLEVKNNNTYLDSIAKNAQERYDRYIFPENTATYLIEDIKTKFNIF